VVAIPAIAVGRPSSTSRADATSRIAAVATIPARTALPPGDSVAVPASGESPVAQVPAIRLRSTQRSARKVTTIDATEGSANDPNH